MFTALTIAGSDPSGGAGIQGDLKTFHAHGVYGMAVVTALTAQNTRGVTGVFDVPAPFVAKQIEAVLGDMPVGAAKTGMLSNADTADAVASVLRRQRVPFLIVDPVMVATSGDALLRDDAVAVLVERLFPLATLVTPNLPEAERLTEMKILSPADMRRAATRLRERGARAVLVKGASLDRVSVVAAPLLALSAVAGIGLLARRVATPGLRTVSSPDDYASILAVTLLIVAALVSMASDGPAPSLLVVATLVFLYAPLGKIRHCVFFFLARAGFGRLLGRRGVLPGVAHGARP